MDFPDNLKYSQTHEWVRIEEKKATVGITDYAQDALGDIVYIELPAVGTKVEAGKPFGVIESVKAAEDLYAPLSGSVVSRNDNVVKSPELVNRSCYGDGWMIVVEVSNEAELETLLTAEQYQTKIAQEHH